MATVVLFDSYPITQLGFKQVLRSAEADIRGYVVANIAELAVLAAEQIPDILILTINTPKNRYPLPLLEQCRAVCPAVKVVLYDEEHFPSQTTYWLKSEALGYLLKSEPASVLLQCIEMVLNGGRYLSPEGWDRFLSPERPQRMILKQPKLGRREYEIARYLSSGKSTTWIANQLGRKPSTVSTVKKRIFSKLKVDNVVQLCSIFHTVNYATGKPEIQKRMLPPRDNGIPLTLS